MGKVFFTSDLHFSHRNIAKFCPHHRPQSSQYGDMTAFDRYMIEMWNDTVDVDDDVYNLGDLTFSSHLPNIMQCLSQLNGRHHLILGNHDDIIELHSKKFLTTLKHDGHPVLSSIQHYLKLKIQKKNFILFHYPIAEWDGCHKGYYHLHGHIHNRMSDIQGKILNVGFDLHGRFLTLDDITEFLDHLPHLNHHHKLSPLVDLTPPIIFQQDCDYHHQAKQDSQRLDNINHAKILIQQQLNNKTSS